MRIEINITNKAMYSIILLMVLLISVGVYAYNSGKAPNVLGHSGEEIEVTLPNGQKVKLNEFVTSTTNSLSSPAWPSGNYCIIQAKDKQCPSGFTVTSPSYNSGTGWEFIIGAGLPLQQTPQSTSGNFNVDGGDLKFAGGIQGQVWAFCCK